MSKHEGSTLVPAPLSREAAPFLSSSGSRRTFLRDGTFATIATVALSSCKPAAPESGSAAAVPGAEDGAVTGGTMPPAAATPTPRESADAMDAMHEKGVKAFPAKTAGLGNVPLQPRIENGVKIFELTAKKAPWEVTPGKMVDAWTYNGMVPGPLIRVREGDRVRLVVKNDLPESTAIHFHGLEIPNNQDGVPYITQPPIKPGESYTYEFAAPNPGSHMYHSHHNSTKQVSLGLLGAFIIDPKNRGSEPRADIDQVMILNDGLGGYTLNGKGFPATQPVVAKLGQTVRIRFMNEGMMIHPMHLHGMHMTVITKDGWPLPAPFRCDTLNIAPGERWDVLVKCTNPGTWAFHCHILPHAESEGGMFGMVTALIVQA
jgi:FtsP/CotA-like multicopper oxidase with cupredoxin domain